MDRRSHQDSAVRFVTAKSWPGRATRTRQYDLLRPRVGQKKPPRLGSTICYGYGQQKEPPRLGSTICYCQESARKSHQDSAVRFVVAKRGPERAHQDSDLLRPNVGQKEPPRLGSTICYGQEFGQKEPPRLASTICYGQTWARRSHQDSAVRFVTAKSWPERATKTRQYDLLRPRLGQKESPRLGSTICYGQTWARKSHQDSAVRFVTAKSWPEKATETRQYDLLRPIVGQKEPPRLGSTICYGQELARKSHQDSPVRFVTAKSWPEGASKTRRYDLLRPRVGQKESPRLGSTICYGQELARKSRRDSAVRFVTTKRGPERAFVAAKRGPERATQTRQCFLLRPRVWLERVTKTRQYDLLRPRRGPERATETRQYDLLRPRVARKSHRDSAVLFVTAKRGPERATKIRQYDLLRPNVCQKKPPRLGSTICYGQELARKSHRDSAVRFVTAKSWPERVTETRQYDLLRPRVGQKEPPRLASTICYGQELARRSLQDSAVRFVTTKSWPERVTKTRQYDLLRPRVG